MSEFGKSRSTLEERFQTILDTEVVVQSCGVLTRFATRLGLVHHVACPCNKSPGSHAVRGEPEHSDAFRILLLQGAGPFSVEKGFLTTFSLGDLARSLEKIANEFGVIDLSEAFALMSTRGIRDEFIEDVIQQSGHFRLWDQGLLVWSGSGVEKAVDGAVSTGISCHDRGDH